MCERCDAVRTQAGLLLALTFSNQSKQTIAQTIAVIYSCLKHDAINSGKEDGFNIMWELMIAEEFKYLASIEPIEPSKFEKNYNIFQHIKK